MTWTAGTPHHANLRHRNALVKIWLKKAPDFQFHVEPVFLNQFTLTALAQKLVDFNSISAIFKTCLTTPLIMRGIKNVLYIICPFSIQHYRLVCL